MPWKKFNAQTIFLVSIYDYNKLKYYLFSSLKLKNNSMAILDSSISSVLAFITDDFWNLLPYSTASFAFLTFFFFDRFYKVFRLFSKLFRGYIRPNSCFLLWLWWHCFVYFSIQPPCSVSNLITNIVWSSSK